MCGVGGQSLHPFNSLTEFNAGVNAGRIATIIVLPNVSNPDQTPLDDIRLRRLSCADMYNDNGPLIAGVVKWELKIFFVLFFFKFDYFIVNLF